MDERQKLDYWKSQLEPYWLETMAYVHKGKNIEEVIGYAFADLLSQPERLKRADASDFKRLVNSWLINTRYPSGEKKKAPTRISLDGI